MTEVHDGPVKTFSVAFEEDPAGNELQDARKIASLFETDHHELLVSMNTEGTALANISWHLDEPVADLSAIGFYAICRLAREHVTVALSGQGADELFGGYRKHRVSSLIGGVSRPRLARRGAQALAGIAGGKTRRFMEAYAASSPAVRYLAMSGLAGTPTLAEFGTRPLNGKRRNGCTRPRRHLVDDRNPLAAALYIDAQLGLPDDMLHYFDRTSMAHSLEVRVPFLDHPLVEWAATVPTTLKLRRDTTKYVLKETARHLLPTFAIDKPKMGFFNASLDRWLEHQAASLADTHLLNAEAHVESLVDIEVLREFVHGSPAQRRMVFRVLILELWLERTSASLPLARSA